MKNTKRCPKCGCEEILFVPGTVGYGTGNNVIRTGVTVFSSVEVDRYVCTACGFSEEWIREEDLKSLIRAYE